MNYLPMGHLRAKELQFHVLLVVSAKIVFYGMLARMNGISIINIWFSNTNENRLTHFVFYENNAGNFKGISQFTSVFQ